MSGYRQGEDQESQGSEGKIDQTKDRQSSRLSRQKSRDTVSTRDMNKKLARMWRNCTKNYFHRLEITFHRKIWDVYTKTVTSKSFVSIRFTQFTTFPWLQVTWSVRRPRGDVYRTLLSLSQVLRVFFSYLFVFHISYFLTLNHPETSITKENWDSSFPTGTKPREFYHKAISVILYYTTIIILSQ